MPLIDTTKRDRIRQLNDTFLKSLDPNLGRVMLTAGVRFPPSDVRFMAIHKTGTPDSFTPEKDPYGEHDFGSFELDIVIDGKHFLWRDILRMHRQQMLRNQLTAALHVESGGLRSSAEAPLQR